MARWQSQMRTPYGPVSSPFYRSLSDGELNDGHVSEWPLRVTAPARSGSRAGDRRQARTGQQEATLAVHANKQPFVGALAGFTCKSKLHVTAWH